MPVAHGEGSYFADETTLDAIESNSQVVFRYVDESGIVTPDVESKRFDAQYSRHLQ